MATTTRKPKQPKQPTPAPGPDPESAARVAAREARAAARDATAVVRTYLDMIVEKPKPKGRRTVPFLEGRIASVKERLEVEAATALERLLLTQDLMDLEQELADRTATMDVGAVEAAFVDVAAAFSEQRGISYAAWRKLGVPAAVLRRAGVAGIARASDGT